ncbi:hypothetical protein FRC11_000946 [Ceratobasidium sp. 423]|nr:hypothetical protein FRC11_000946 [Ceratobasidium sp. 423]
MPASYPLSSPIKSSCPPVDTCKAAEAYQDINNLGLLRDVSSQPFVDNYLPGCSLEVSPWAPQQKSFVQRITGTKPGREKTLYNGNVPLLRLLNDLSKSAFERSPTKQKAVVFLSSDQYMFMNPFTPQHCRPDIITVRVEVDDEDFPQIDSECNQSWLDQADTVCKDLTRDQTFTWYELAAVGEAKVEGMDGQYQLASYLQNHLQVHPELNATVGFLTNLAGYALFYHDTAAIHRSRFSWEQPGPLCEFVQNLYNQPFRDISMWILDPNHPAWATKVENDIHLSESPQAQAGPGQRRCTSKAVNMRNGEVVFIKDIWRDERRLFFEASLLGEAHKGGNLAGLMLVHSHGYVTDRGESIRTTHLNPKSVDGQASGRYKMRMMTKDIGHSLGEISSLRQFLCVMYDACVGE